MPPPTNINVAVQLYSKRFIARLQRRIALLKAFSTNLSDEFGNPGTTIDVPILSADPAGAWDDATNNFSRSATDVNTRPVTLDQRIITGFSITMMHLAKFLPHWWEGKADLNVNAIAQAIVDPILGLITPENYGYTADTNLVWNPATLTLDNIADLRSKLVDKGMVMERTALCLSPTVYSKLLAKLDASITGSDTAIRYGILDRVLGFEQIIEVPGLTIPGFACHPDAILAGSKRMEVADTTPYKIFTSMVEPNTGMHLNSVVLTNGPTGQTSYSVSAMFGCEVGEENSLVRLVTAMPTPPPPETPPAG